MIKVNVRDLHRLRRYLRFNPSREHKLTFVDDLFKIVELNRKLVQAMDGAVKAGVVRLEDWPQSPEKWLEPLMEAEQFLNYFEKIEVKNELGDATVLGTAGGGPEES